MTKKMFNELPEDEQKMLIQDIIARKLTCEPRKLTAAEVYALIDNTQKEKETANVDDNQQVKELLQEESNLLEEENPPENKNVNDKKTIEECKKVITTEPNNKSYKERDGLCITCLSDVYDGVCSNCGRRYNWR